MPPFYQSGSITTSPSQPVLFPDWQDMAISPSSAPSIEDFPLNPRAPYYIRHSVNLEQQISPSTVLSLTYTGSRGVHLLREVGLDLAAPEILPDGTSFFPNPGTLRDPNFSSMLFKLDDGFSSYYGLAVTLQRRWSAGLQFQASFNWSRLIDNGPSAAGNGDFAGDNDVPRSYLGSDPGPSPWNAKRTFSINTVYDLPLGAGKKLLRNAKGIEGFLANGWQIGSIIQLSDGQPFSALLGFTPPGYIAGGAVQTYYPNLVMGTSNSPVLGGPNNYFSATSFSIPPAGTLGNLGRNTIVGPGLTDLDISVMKNTRLAEGKTLQFRADAFNLLNHANFGLPQNSIYTLGSTVPRPDVGRITALTTPSREMQFSLRFVF